MPFLIEVDGSDRFFRYKMGFDTTKPDVNIRDPERFQLLHQAHYFLVNGVPGFG